MCSEHNRAILVTGLQGERLTFANNLFVLAVRRQLYEESSLAEQISALEKSRYLRTQNASIHAEIFIRTV